MSEPPANFGAAREHSRTADVAVAYERRLGPKAVYLLALPWTLGTLIGTFPLARWYLKLRYGQAALVAGISSLLCALVITGQYLLAFRAVRGLSTEHTPPSGYPFYRHFLVVLTYPAGTIMAALLVYFFFDATGPSAALFGLASFGIATAISTALLLVWQFSALRKAATTTVTWETSPREQSPPDKKP